MEDVIFSGSSARDALNFAEVSLTLSNESKILPIDYDEVTITRRLYRSGESEYLINKNTVRLKDIHELLLGTGIGTESYSVIEQGKMDRILNSKPDERREIFEEAAGITKFKSKKKEALRKLEQTDQNLLRISDIILEVKRQIGSVERQAKKAEVYKVEFEKLKNLELSVASREFLIFESHRRSKEEALEALKNQEIGHLAEAQSIHGRFEEKRRGLEHTDEVLKENQLKELTASSEIRANQDRSLLNRERIGELLARHDQIGRQVEISKRRIDEFGGEYARILLEFEAVGKEEMEGRYFLGSVETEFAAMEAGIQNSLDESERLKGDFAEKASKRASLQSETAKIRAEINALLNGLKKLRHEEETLLGEIREINETLRPGLFEGTRGLEQPAPARFEQKLHEFKSKILTIVRSLLGKQAAEPGPEEEAGIEREIRGFTDDIVKIHGQVAEWQSRAEHLQVSRKKLEGKLAAVSLESQNLLNEEQALLQRERDRESEIAFLNEEEKAMKERLLAAEQNVKLKSKDKESLLVRLAETRSKAERRKASYEKIEKDKNWISESKANEEAQLLSAEKETQDIFFKKEALGSENAFLQKELERLTSLRDEILRQREGLSREREALLAELGRMEAEKSDKDKFLRGVREKVHSYELEDTELRFEIDRLKDRMFNAYQVDLLAMTGTGGEESFDLEKAKDGIKLQRERLNKMGPVNLVALEEHDQMRERFEFLTKQQQDLLQAKDDLHKAIVKINRTTRELFTDTFQKIQKHFSEYFKMLFGGGTAELVLLDENDVLESGIEIIARPPGKKLQNISLLSGGEKALTAIALLFALFKVKPSPFCILDEIDAPLDELNVDRFCSVLKNFISDSQFILITHNKRTMNLADAMYGITMAETGVSKVVSVRFSEKSSVGEVFQAQSQKEALAI